jgi:hypothetical protein
MLLIYTVENVVLLLCRVKELTGRLEVMTVELF